MIEVLPESEERCLGFTITGKATDADYVETFIPRIEEALGEHDKIRVLIVMGEEYEGFTLGAMWEDAKFGTRHASDFEKIATVGAPKWMEWGVKLGDHFLKAECRTYSLGELDEAWRWLKE